MKKRKTEHNSIKMIKAVALILFLALLFTPEQRNRSVIAGTAITGSRKLSLPPDLHAAAHPSPVFLKKYSHAQA